MNKAITTLEQAIANFTKWHDDKIKDQVTGSLMDINILVQLVKGMNDDVFYLFSVLKWVLQYLKQIESVPHEPR